MRTNLVLLAASLVLVTSCEEKKQAKAVAPLVVPKRDWMAEIREHEQREYEAALAIEQEKQAEHLKQLAALRLQVAEQELRETQDQIDEERRERKRQRREMESAPAPMSQFDARRLGAAGVPGFTQRTHQEPEQKPVIVYPTGGGNYRGTDGSVILRTGDSVTIYPGK